jgi:hypothetical protein
MFCSIQKENRKLNCIGLSKTTRRKKEHKEMKKKIFSVAISCFMYIKSKKKGKTELTGLNVYFKAAALLVLFDFNCIIADDKSCFDFIFIFVENLFWEEKFCLKLWSMLWNWMIFNYILSFWNRKCDFIL